ncbi:MAG TPA: hypothetical protein VIQ00_05835, partial [Chitinophagaceae bacterium]
NLNYMSKCNFSIPFSTTSSELIAKAKSAIESNGGFFEGDESTGNFQVKVMGTIAGTYDIDGQEIHISIDNKPMFISCTQLESFMRNSFGK